MKLVNHVEIPVLNLEDAKSFYKKVLDIDIDIEMMPNYGIWDDRKTTSLGFFVVEEIPTPCINLVFEVKDIPKALETVKKAGGEVVKDKYLIAEGIGYSADFKDNAGVKLSLFSRE